MATYANGIPSWVDLGSPDPDASAAFYGGLFGWTTTEPGPVEETGGYRMFLKGDQLVAGLGPNQEGAPPSWTTYLAVDDADKTAELVKANGGMAFVEPMDVMDAGRMAIFADASGAMFGVWQAGEHTGAQVKLEPGAIAWNELMTRDVDGAKRFYSAVFGVDPTPFPQAEGPEYTVLNVNGDGVAGILPMPADMPAEMPNVWITYFGTDDTDATVAKATALGASVMAEPLDVPGVGRLAALVGPHGENFAVIKGDPQQP